MKDIVTRTEIRYIRKRADAGQTAKEISYALGITLARVEVFMPKDPEVEKREAKERADARAKTKRENPEKMNLNAQKKKRMREQIAKEDAAAEAAAVPELEDADGD